MNVKDILDKRERRVVTVVPSTSVRESARIMTEQGFGALVIVDAGDRMVGILSERDVLAAVAESESDLSDLTARELMTVNVVTCAPEDTIIQVILKFDALGIRHLVVVDDGERVGVLSIRDVLEAFSRLILEKKIFGQQRFATEFAEALAAA
jgi:CBS domain-containing protein